MLGRRGKSKNFIFLTVICACAATVGAEFLSAKYDKSVGELGKDEIEDKLQECSFVQSLAKYKHENKPSGASWTAKLFAVLFPSSSPAINAFLATLYISGPPNFLLALCPPNIDPSSLTIMVAFAVGGLLGDTLFHLLPEIFLGEVAEGEVRFVMIEPNRNLLLGVGIMVGFLTFVAMDKGLRIATGGEGHTHEHGHSHSHEEDSTAVSTGSSAGSPNGDLKRRKAAEPALDKPLPTPPTNTSETSTSIKLSSYLNIIADFTHNITDGLALSSSFYSSPTLGATTTMAVFFHEIPHEVGDFALLIQGGLPKKWAMGMQFVTALGAVLGTCIGVAVQEMGGSSNTNSSYNSGPKIPGIWGTSLSWGDMLLPFTAGTFLYVGTVAVIPELLETGPNKGKELKKTGLQFLAMGVGAAIMLAISWT